MTGLDGLHEPGSHVAESAFFAGQARGQQPLGGIGVLVTAQIRTRLIIRVKLLNLGNHVFRLQQRIASPLGFFIRVADIDRLAIGVDYKFSINVG